MSDVTRMDRLGVPVCISVRPRGLALRVHAGKGLRALDARVGALMEAIEYAAAEPQRSTWRRRTITARAFLRQFDGALRLVDFAPELGKAVAPDHAFVAVECEELLTGARVKLPAELVFVPYAPAEGQRVFGSSTSGLAAGNSAQEATLHALLEVLERDTVSLHLAKDESEWVDPSGFPNNVRPLVARWHELGIRIAVRHLPNEFALPCFEACLHDPGDWTVELAGGSAMHPHRGIALTKAFLEAAQSRLSHIHGGRDDLVQFHLPADDPRAPAKELAKKAAVGRAFDRRRRREFGAVPSVRARGGRGVLLEELLRRVSAAGFGAVFRHHFRVALGDLHVVRVIVPKCHDVEHQPRRIGPRLLSRITADV